MVTNSKKNNGKRIRNIVILVVPVVLILVLVLGWSMRSRGSVAVSSSAMYEVKRGRLVISVTESGEIKARNTTDINSEVEGRTTIVSVVPEGTYITEEDVKNGKILVELDSSELNDEINREEIELADAKANLTDAEEAYGIQLNQNESDITAAELTLKFARMDLQKYVGEEVADKMISLLDATGVGKMEISEIDIASLWEDSSQGLGGEAEQTRMQLQADIEEQEAAYNRDQDQLNWTQKLYDRKFVARTELEAHKMELQRTENRRDQVKISLELFKKYEFPKQVQKFLSDYQEAQRELERRKAQARAREAQALARLQNAKRRYNLRKDQLDKLRRQASASIIRATTVGLVVYASSEDRFRRRTEPIEVGAELRERQKILSIPNTTEMVVEIGVHETSVDKVRPGQRAKVIVEAFPNRVFIGEVIKVAQLPDSQRGWLAPDLKVYTTQVSIEGEHLFLKPGMSAKAEIIVEELDDVVYVPIQAVANRGGKQVCYVKTDSGLEEREVQTGSFNESSIVITEGIEDGALVSLNPPRIISHERAEMLAMATDVGTQEKTTTPQGGSGAPVRSGERSEGGQNMEGQFGGSDGFPQAGASGEMRGPRSGFPDGAAGGEMRRPRGFGFDPAIMEKLKDPEVQKKLETARQEGKLAEELKNLGIELPPEMIQRMESGRGFGRGPGRGARQGSDRGAGPEASQERARDSRQDSPRGSRSGSQN